MSREREVRPVNVARALRGERWTMEADSYTTSWPSEWDSLLSASSHRGTTVTCEKCGRPRRESVHPHSVQVHREGDRVVRRDCVGAEVATDDGAKARRCPS